MEVKNEPVSTTVNPVTQVAEAEVKSASTKLISSFWSENGCINNIDPINITNANEINNKLCGVSLEICL